MAKQATKVSRAANRALSDSKRAAREAQAATRVRRLADEAARAAASAAGAADRASVSAGRGHAQDATSLSELAFQVETACADAVEKAREAMRAEDAGDVAAAVVAANAASRAAQRAASLAAAAAVVEGMSKARAQHDAERLLARSEEERAAQELAEAAEQTRRTVAEGIDRAARYLLVYNGMLLASFARLDDAMLLEDELCQLDLDHKARSAYCEVLDRKGSRLGGYLIAGGRYVSYVRDEELERRLDGRRRRA